ncbi:MULTISPECIES: hypothetical protein [unclassified Serratia (in: enterobacteria)]|uniref:hypothetical protein n=1 Tax=unclassified Serratia (in: enterobacteria) TaxID=2647522 RepID=UPI00046A7850|nr:MULTISPECIES: hypothetical protein [unclassified Serratia (in: enterobacteria)]
MAIDYRRMRATATRLLKENGAEHPFTRGATVSREAGKEVRQAEQNGTVIGVITEYKPSEIDGSLILGGDVLLVATYETEIRVDDRIEVNGKKYRVVHPHPVMPGPILICYRAQLRA